jgi:hypothetical protein
MAWGASRLQHRLSMPSYRPFLDSGTEDLALPHKKGLRIDAVAQQILPFHGGSELAKLCHGGIPEWIL